MTLFGFLLLVLIGAFCGALAEMLVGYSPGGFFASVVVGFLGAFLGTYLARRIGLPSALAITVEGYTIEIIWAILGAVVLVGALALIRRAAFPRSRRPYL